MRGVDGLLAGLCFSALLVSCAGTQSPPPPGVSISRRPNFNGTLSDMASQVTTDVILHYKGAKLLKAQPYEPCPGEAGLQTFRVKETHGSGLLEVAFTQWNGTAVTATYERPAKVPADPRAEEALRRAVCSA